MNAIIDLENTYTSGVYAKRPVAIVRGSGALVWDAEGREYIDCIAGHGVANIGHGRPEVAAAIAAQAQRLITCPEIFYNDVRARLLERLANLVPEEPVYSHTSNAASVAIFAPQKSGGVKGLAHIFLCNSGTEAVEGALKFARIATGRTGIVAAFRGFHGRTMGALSTTWEPHYREPFAPLVPGVSHVHYNDLAAVDAAINEGTAAVIIELVQGEGGVHVACEEYIHGLASLCRERGALLIVDEVQTGFGRTGRLFACQHYDLQPDILCLAKSLAGGVPMGAICLGRRVMESGRITRGIHGSSFGGNPLACAAALATLDILEQEALPQRAAALGEYALERLRALHTSLIREVRGRGLLLGIELSRRVQPYLEGLRERGVLALPAGPNVIRLLPPLVISEEQLERVLEAVEEVLRQELDPLKGDELVSSLDRNSEDARESTALASTADTSGHPDKVPVLAQHAESAALSSTENVLPRHGILAWNPTVQLERSRAGEPSLSSELECLSLQEEYRTNAQKSQASPSAGAFPSSRSPEADGTPERNVVEEAPASPAPGDMRFASPAPARGATTYPKNDQNREVSLLHNMLIIPSYSRQESVLAHYLVEQAQQLGLHSYLDDVGNLIASTHPCEMHTGLQPIILLGHMDTVRGYIPVRLQDGELHGRGAVDAKGPLAAFLCAAGRMARVVPKDSFQHPIVVIGAVEEESASSRGARAVVERYQPFACIIGEPSGSQAVTIGYKGRLLVEYRVTHPVHHSAGSQRNGNEVAVTFWNRVCQHAAEWNEQYAPNSTFAALMPSLRSMSSDQDGLEEQVRLCIGYRLPPNYDVAGLRIQLEQWADEDEASISFSGEEAAFQTTRTTPLARAFISAIRATGGQPVFKHKTGTSDMNVVGPAWGQNIVAYGPGDSRLDHTPQEHIHIAEYIHAIDVLELVLKELALQRETTS